jgi:MFS family permease
VLAEKPALALILGMDSNTTPASVPSPRRLHPTVVILSFVSFLNDFASDIVIPLMPILLAGVLGAGPVVLGAIEGLADAVASFLKLWAGRRSDVMGGRRKVFAVAGYTLSNIARPLLAFAGNWGTVLVLRGTDRVGKGIRSAPRDAMVGDVTDKRNAGLAFGFHRALDNAGAVAGSLGAAWVIYAFSASLNQVILLSAIPGTLGVLLLVFAVREPPARNADKALPLPPLSWSTLSVPMRRYFLVLGLFTLARASETFLMLRGYELKQSLPWLLVMWAALNFVKSMSAYGGGVSADRIGRANVMLTSWTAFALSCWMLCKVETGAGLFSVVVFYGICSGLGEGAERALVNEFGSAKERASAFGWYYMTAGTAAIPGGLIFGGLWQWQGAGIAFSFAGALAGVSALLFRFWAWPRRPSAPPVSYQP